MVERSVIAPAPSLDPDVARNNLVRFTSQHSSLSTAKIPVFRVTVH